MSNRIIIKTIPGDAQFASFTEVALKLHTGENSKYAKEEQLNEDFLNCCYVLLADNVPVARVALYKNPNLTYMGLNTLCLGNYECIDDIAVATELLNHVANEARRLGADYIIGPMNGSTWDNYRFTTHHNYAPFFLEPFQPLYYNDHFLAIGLEPIASYFSSIDLDFKYNNPEIEALATAFGEMGMVLRNIDLQHYQEELEKLYPFLLETFKSNFLYTPISLNSFLKKYLAAEKFIDSQFVIIAEDAEKNPVGLSFCVKDYLDPTGKSMIVKTLARHPDKKWKGLGNILGNEIGKKCLKLGYTSVVHALIYEQGTSLNLSKNYSGKLYKNYALYGKKLRND